MGAVRVLGVLIAAALVVVTPATSAAAGGAVLEIDDGYVLVDQVVTAHSTFSAHIGRTGRISDGPWYAYLVPGNRWIGRGPIPAAAIPIGRLNVEVMQRFPDTGRASLTFSVPDADPGKYTLSICNDPCTESILGDLIGGWVTIAKTEEQSQIQRLADRLEAGLSSIRGSRQEANRDDRELEESLEALTARVGRLETSADAAPRVAPPRREPQSDSPLGILLGFVAGVGVVLFAWFLLGRRRRSAEEDPPPPPEPGRSEWDVPEDRRLFDEVSSKT